MKIERLVSMINDIATFFASDPEPEVAARAVESHISRFWEPRMRRQIVEHYRHGGTGLTEGVTMGLVILRTPVRAPQANAFCERLIGTIRRECLDFVIPLNERHLPTVLRDWCAHYNRGRPHASLGPGIS
jgi:transposase InsO family protein